MTVDWLAGLRTLSEVSRPGPQRIVYRAVVDPIFTIGPKVHGGSLQMPIAQAARSEVTDLVIKNPDTSGQHVQASARIAAGEMVPVAPTVCCGWMFSSRRS